MDAARVLARGLRRLRESRDWSQARLAEASGLSVQFIAGLEQEKRTPSLPTLDALADAFGLTISAVFAAGEATRPRGLADEVAPLLAGVAAAHRDRVLRIVRDVCAIASAPRRRRR